MKTYIISYDLVKHGKDYTKLIDEIKKFNHKKVLLSTWKIFIDSKYSANEVKNHFLNYIDSNDRLFVTEEYNSSSYNLIS